LSSGEKPDNYIAAIALQLQQTQTLLQTVLTEIRENSSEQAALSTELKSLRLNVNTLSNIIRGGDGNTKPLVLEVEMMKHADLHLDKRISAIVEDIEEQILGLSKNIAESSARADASNKELEAKIELADKQRREWETAKLQAEVATNAAKLQAEVATNNDMRLDSRTRLQTWSTIIIAVIALVSSVLTLLLK
jgi:chromosome segregation ATPase